MSISVTSAAICLTTGQESNHNQLRDGVDVPQKRNPLMDQQKRRSWLLISVFSMIGLALLNLVTSFWGFVYEDEKIKFCRDCRCM